MNWQPVVTGYITYLHLSIMLNRNEIRTRVIHKRFINKPPQVHFPKQRGKELIVISRLPPRVDI